MAGFWQDKRVLVTGGKGFLGSYVVNKLKENSCREIFVPKSSDYNLVQMEAVKKVYQDSRPDIVIHLAARVGGIGANRQFPGEFFYENLMMGVQMMEIGRQNKIKKFVALGTVCCYPKFTPTPFKEEDFWNGYPEETNAPYGLAKKMHLVQSQAYRQQYGFNSIFLIPTNLYGPGDNFDPVYSHVIPALIRKFFEAKRDKKEEVVLWGTGNPTREFLYVEDCAEAIVLAAEKYNKAEPINIGSGCEIAIKDLAMMIAEIIGFQGKIIWDSSWPDGQPRRILDTSKAYTEFDFKAKTPFKKGLQQTIEQHKQGL